MLWLRALLVLSFHPSVGPEQVHTNASYEGRDVSRFCLCSQHFRQMKIVLFLGSRFLVLFKLGYGVELSSRAITYQGQLGLQFDFQTLDGASQFSNFCFMAGHLFNVAVNFCGQFPALEDEQQGAKSENSGMLTLPAL